MPRHPLPLTEALDTQVPDVRSPPCVASHHFTVPQADMDTSRDAGLIRSFAASDGAAPDASPASNEGCAGHPLLVPASSVPSARDACRRTDAVRKCHRSHPEVLGPPLAQDGVHDRNSNDLPPAARMDASLEFRPSRLPVLTIRVYNSGVEGVLGSGGFDAEEIHGGVSSG